MLTDFIDPKQVTYLPNTAGCFTADDAIRTLRLAREAGGWDLVKLEVLGEARTLYPDMRETLKATEVLAREGFLPMVYCVDDPIAAKQLEEAGAVAVMPLGAPIGSGLGIQNRVTIRLIVEGAKVPVLVDAGVGTASDAAVAMELGVDGVLMNTAIAEAKDPIRMARAMKLAVESGREAYLAVSYTHLDVYKRQGQRQHSHACQARTRLSTRQRLKIKRRPHQPRQREQGHRQMYRQPHMADLHILRDARFDHPPAHRALQSAQRQQRQQSGLVALRNAILDPEPQ